MCHIVIDLNGKNPDQVYATAKQEIDDHGSFTETGARSLDFKVKVVIFVKIEGSLMVSDAQLIVDTTKNGGVSCEKIEEEMRKFLNAG